MIIKGKPDESYLIKLVESKNPDEVMPPHPSKDKHGKIMKQEEIALLRQWVAEGAEFSDHWAFTSPKKSRLPKLEKKDWCENEIDHYILAGIQAKGLKPTKVASKREIIRRVTLDLTGLLPTLEETEAFVSDLSSNAYEKLVDRLLASSRFGEHRARYWLDYSRYGDTSGLHNDAYQSRWPYRDYLIRSMNADKPYDVMTREHIAGDLYPAKDVDQIIATGFIRCGISTGEGGTLIEELRVNNARERTEALGAVYLGLTTGCAACHDHKYDPLSRRDFYRLTAFFNNLEEKPSNDDRKDWPPFIKLPTSDKLAEYNVLLTKKTSIEQKIRNRRESIDSLIKSWQKSGGRAKSVSTVGLQVRLKLDEAPYHAAGTEKKVVLNNSAPRGGRSSFEIKGSLPHWNEETWLWPTFRLATGTRLNLGGLGDFEANQAFSAGTWIKPRDGAGVDGGGGAKIGAIIAKMDGGGNYTGWNLIYEKGVLMVQLINKWPSNQLSVSTTTPVLPYGKWNHVFFTYDGSGKASGVRIYLNGKEQKTKIDSDQLKGSIKTKSDLWVGRRHPDQMIFQESAYQDIRIYQRKLNPDEVQRLPYEDLAAEILKDNKKSGPEDWTIDERSILTRFAFGNKDKIMKRLVQKSNELQAELDKLTAKGSISLICKERNTPAYADDLSRGAYASRVERVTPGVPDFLPQLPHKTQYDRRDLAEWLISKENPLTARVAVNRVWQEIFGRGLVETSDDFGIVGMRPSHPDLLDFLAVDFMENEWRFKRLYKKIVMSATYRQTAKADPAIVGKDLSNIWLARAPRYRMDAEMIRDSALQASGLLVEKIGGPSVKPYMPQNIWESVSGPGSNTRIYKQQNGENLYRRSMYSFLKKMAPMPNLEVFDAVDRAASCVRRQRTNTPMAALTLMNDPQFLEAARHLGLRAIKEVRSKDAKERIQYIGRILLSSEFDKEPLDALLTLHGKLKLAYTGNSESSQKLLSVGESPPDKEISADEQAIWMLIASAAMNTDAALNK